MALLARTTRAAVVEVLTTDYITTARSKGISTLLINGKHVFRNTLILVLTTAGLQFGSLMGQTVVVEKLFSWPGLPAGTIRFFSAIFLLRKAAPWYLFSYSSS
jgi:peptide/nickel transport system permease protein